jgi:hypothetical protein
MENISLFDKILADALRAGIGPAKSLEAINWYKARTEKFSKGTDESDLVGESERLRSNWQLGRMYFFAYDPKHKATLPYYDRFPLIFPIDPAPRKGRFLGINLHYLAPKYRAVLLDALLSIANNKRFNDSTKLNISYKTLAAAARFKWFKPCLKMYLTSHVKSKFVRIESVEWPIALFLPVEQFKKAPKSKVWEDSRRIAMAQGAKFDKKQNAKGGGRKMSATQTKAGQRRNIRKRK